jgi:hypothetical protein
MFGALEQAAIVPLADDPDHIPRAWVVLMKRLDTRNSWRKAAIGARLSPI